MFKVALRIELKIEKMTASKDINNQESENQHYTLEEYFEFEYKAEGKHEFHNGLKVMVLLFII
jgi:hypothetical protein